MSSGERGEPDPTLALSVAPSGTQTHRPAEPSRSATVNGVLLDGRYRLQVLIGSGATADVYRGVDELLGRAVAIKVFPDSLADTTSLARQRSEMHALAGLNHPNLVTIFDARLAAPGIDPKGNHSGSDRTYLVMELVEGPSLAAQLTDGPLELATVSRLGAGIGDALTVVHSKGLVHRDIKPANILTSENGTFKLGDFGIARMLDSARLTATNDVVGTAAYLSPEQVRGEESGSPTDIYALGLVLLECLTGKREFPGTPVEAALVRLHRDPVVPAESPAPWPDLLTRMTSTDPSSRPTAREVSDILRGHTVVIGANGSSPAFVGGTATAVTAPVEYDRTRVLLTAGESSGSSALWATMPPRRKPILRWLAAFAAMLVAGLVTVNIVSRDAGGTRPEPVSNPAVTSTESTAQSTSAGTSTPAVPVVVTSTVTAATPTTSSRTSLAVAPPVDDRKPANDGKPADDKSKAPKNPKAGGGNGG